MPTGSPVDDSASGSEIAGSPVAFCSGVNAAQSTSLSMTDSKSAVGSRYPIRGVTSASVGISTASYTAPSLAVMRCDADSRRMASGTLCRLRAALRSSPSVMLSRRVRSKLGPNIRRPPRTTANARNDQYTRKSSLKRAGTGFEISVTRWPSSSSRAADFSVNSRISGLASREIDCVHTAMCRRCLLGCVTSPMGASLGLRYTRSASRRNAAVSRTDRDTTPLATR